MPEFILNESLSPAEIRSARGYGYPSSRVAHPYHALSEDESGLDDGESEKIEAWCEQEGVRSGDCLSCDDAGFMWRHDAPRFSLAGDCQTYTFAVRS